MLGFSTACGLAASAEEAAKQSPPHFLRDRYLDEFTEFEFFPNGKLLRYIYFSEERIQGRICQNTTFLVESLKWQENADGFSMQKGDLKRIWKYDAAQKRFFAGETDLKKVDHLEFFNILQKYCGRALFEENSKENTTRNEPTKGSLNFPFRLIHAKTADGFIEYEFHPEGKLTVYSYNEKNSESRDDLPIKDFQPRFKVEFLQWRIKEGELLIRREEKEQAFPYTVDDKNAYFDGLTWTNVSHLEFGPKLFFYCEKPRPKQ